MLSPSSLDIPELAPLPTCPVPIVLFTSHLLIITTPLQLHSSVLGRGPRIHHELRFAWLTPPLESALHRGSRQQPSQFCDSLRSSACGGPARPRHLLINAFLHQVRRCAQHKGGRRTTSEYFHRSHNQWRRHKPETFGDEA